MIDEDARDDMELMEGFIAMSEGKLNVVPGLLASLLGEEQKKKLYEHCRNKETGRVRSSAIFVELNDIMDVAREKAEQTKN